MKPATEWGKRRKAVGHSNSIRTQALEKADRNRNASNRVKRGGGGGAMKKRKRSLRNRASDTVALWEMQSHRQPTTVMTRLRNTIRFGAPLLIPPSFNPNGVYHPSFYASFFTPCGPILCRYAALQRSGRGSSSSSSYSSHGSLLMITSPPRPTWITTWVSMIPV